MADPGRSRRGGSGQRARVTALLSARSGAITANAYELGGELAAEVGGHPQTVRRYVREWQESQRTVGAVTADGEGTYEQRHNVPAADNEAEA